MVKGTSFIAAIILLLSLIICAQASAETKAVTLQVFCSIPKYLEFPPPIEKEELEGPPEEQYAPDNGQSNENLAEETHSRHTRYQGDKKEVIYTIIER